MSKSSTLHLTSTDLVMGSRRCRICRMARMARADLARLDLGIDGQVVERIWIFLKIGIPLNHPF
jgi:hypothetical protein